jgi:DNA-binding GntR family transcriptional regulator
MNIDRNSSTPSYVQVAEYLRLQILAGNYLPGSRIPAEAELIRQSKLSRVTVRKGLGLLEAGGWIVRKQGLGAFVRETINQELSSAQTITEVMVERGITPRIKMLSFAAVTPPAGAAPSNMALRLSPARRPPDRPDPINCRRAQRRHNLNRGPLRDGKAEMGDEFSVPTTISDF